MSFDHDRINHCDCEDCGVAAGWLCGKPECHRTLKANALLQTFMRILADRDREGPAEGGAG
jgi:hypothetical protein